jgi:hypothetical protein
MKILSKNSGSAIKRYCLNWMSGNDGFLRRRRPGCGARRHGRVFAGHTHRGDYDRTWSQGAGCAVACAQSRSSSGRRTQIVVGSRPRFADDLNALIDPDIHQYLAQSGSEVVFLWQGGEPTLAGLDFCRRAVALRRRFRGPRQLVSNSLQTNGVLLDEAWCAFLRSEDFLVGISLDGPEDRHDRYRRDKVDTDIRQGDARHRAAGAARV